MKDVAVHTAPQVLRSYKGERRDINVVPTYPCSQLNPVSPNCVRMLKLIMGKVNQSKAKIILRRKIKQKIIYESIRVQRGELMYVRPYATRGATT
jgi:hypothetical protein